MNICLIVTTEHRVGFERSRGFYMNYILGVVREVNSKTQRRYLKRSYQVQRNWSPGLILLANGAAPMAGSAENLQNSATELGLVCKKLKLKEM